MRKPTKQEKIEYVANLAEQLAAMCRDDYPVVATMLLAAANLARERKFDHKL